MNIGHCVSILIRERPANGARYVILKLTKLVVWTIVRDATSGVSEIHYAVDIK